MSGDRAAAHKLLAELEASGIRMGLDSMRETLAGLGEPQKRLPHVLVAGTNGKGSTAAMVSAALSTAGYRTGLYTSPHLESVRERLRIDGRAIGYARLAERLERVVGVSERLRSSRPTYFEALTAAAYSWFADEAEIGVLEVGLGGRLDATNCGDPLASLVTEIGIDHAEILGSSLREIALEKAGILRPSRPAIACVHSPEAREALAAKAREIGALWIDVASDTRWRERGDGTVELTTPRATYRLRSPLAGEHQLGNLALAVRALEVLGESGGPRCGRSAIERGVERCRWPGRLERVSLEGELEVVLDAAHNAQGAEALRRYLTGDSTPYRLLFGALRDKDAAAVLPPLADGASGVVLTKPDSPRAADPRELADHLGGRPARIEGEVGAALSAALEPPEERVVVCGSIYLVGDVRERLRSRFGVPSPAAETSLLA